MSDYIFRCEEEGPSSSPLAPHNSNCSSAERSVPDVNEAASSLDPRVIRQLVQLTQEGLPLVSDPWKWLGRRLGMSPEAVLDFLTRLHQDGVVRRIAAVPNHYRLGYRYNGMTVWDVDDQRVDILGRQIGALPYVSHCYRRPRRQGWPYNLFVMVHGLSAAEIDHYRISIRNRLGTDCRADEMLVSERILKKTGVRIPSSGLSRGKA